MHKYNSLLSHIINYQNASIAFALIIRVDFKLPHCVSGNVIKEVSNSPYGHNMSAFVLLKTDKIWLLDTNETGCIVVYS